MTITFYMLVSLCLVLIRTTLIPAIPLFEKFYDLLIPIIIYLGFFRRKREGIPIVIFFGLIMDSLCGGPMGLYLLTYIWLYTAIRWLTRVLHAGSLPLLALAVALGVTFEISILLGYMAFIAAGASIPVDAGKTVFLQIVWALLTGPLIMIIIGWFQKRLDFWRSKIFAD
ncbi:MAG: rod shape-determining protein MreD [Desulfatitalea sp.]|nr:rod shape-determining protein MreD [Desulfatitalea sp.]NNK02807.1 rod shape-determining protein MreD [Desulfatitalea sp.]